MHIQSRDKSLSLNFRFIIGYPPYYYRGFYVQAYLSYQCYQCLVKCFWLDRVIVVQILYFNAFIKKFAPNLGLKLTRTIREDLVSSEAQMYGIHREDLRMEDPGDC